ncbi:MAG: LPS export ABC transporter periplasmic protein LptC [Deltaproteobacteria bacterium RIFOXYD12_FULL_50_9]|nr:MAG: LPS export ABC transporter periplasmic protein LptC [Deltaproteobacteria bacterium RIFOXYD12_FULL_50_9]
MMSGSRNLLWLLPLILLLASPFWWPMTAGFLTPRGDDLPAAAETTNQQSSFLIEQLDFLQHSEGREEIRLKAARASTFATDAPIIMEEIKTTINDKTGKVFLLRGNKGVYDTKQQILTLTDSVNGTTTEGYVLSAQYLRYLNQQNLLESDQPVQLTGPNMKILAGTLSFNTETRAFSLGGRIKFSSQPDNRLPANQI